MLNKTAAHPILQHDSDLKIFLESDAFNMDVKHREHREPGLGESKGMFSAIGFGSGGSGKFIEHDDWFHDRKIYLDALETQLKSLLKSIDAVVIQRKALAEAAGDFSASLHALAAVELSPSLSAPLVGLSDLQLRIRELYERQAQQDVLTLGITVDEYIRLISSIKTAFTQRQKSFHTWHAAEAELQKRKATQEKVLRQGKTQQDRLNQLQADVSEGERRCHQARLLFEDMGRLMRAELERFEREKVEDFKNGVETFLEGAVEAQKEVSAISTIIVVTGRLCLSSTNYELCSSLSSGKHFSCNSTLMRTTTPRSSNLQLCRRSRSGRKRRIPSLRQSRKESGRKKVYRTKIGIGLMRMLQRQQLRRLRKRSRPVYCDSLSVSRGVSTLLLDSASPTRLHRTPQEIRCIELYEFGDIYIFIHQHPHA